MGCRVLVMLFVGLRRKVGAMMLKDRCEMLFEWRIFWKGKKFLAFCYTSWMVVGR